LPAPTPLEIPEPPAPPPPSALEPPPPERKLPESQLLSPQQDRVSLGLKYDSRVLRRTVDAKFHPGWQYRVNQQNQITGFDFSNHGGNRILPDRYDSRKNQFFGRDFQFHFDERARQDIHLMVVDWAPSRDRQFRLSELMNSVMVFFPRVVLPAVVNYAGSTIVTLPTGEEVKFNAETGEILGGVLEEEPVDLNPDHLSRRFPAVRYTGKGIVIRADARGTDPRLNGAARIISGSQSNCADNADCVCKVPTKDLWNPSGAVRFKFATDAEFEKFVMSRCGFPLAFTKNDPPSS